MPQAEAGPGRGHVLACQSSVRSCVTKWRSCRRRWAACTVSGKVIYRLFAEALQRWGCGFSGSTQSQVLETWTGHHCATWALPDVTVISSLFLGRVSPSRVTINSPVQPNTGFHLHQDSSSSSHSLARSLCHLVVTSSDAQPCNSPWSVPAWDLLKQHSKHCVSVVLSCAPQSHEGLLEHHWWLHCSAPCIPLVPFRAVDAPRTANHFIFFNLPCQSLHTSASLWWSWFQILALQPLGWQFFNLMLSMVCEMCI